MVWTFLLSSILSLLSPSLWETARYRLKYCLKGPLNPKQPTNQLIGGTLSHAELSIIALASRDRNSKPTGKSVDPDQTALGVDPHQTALGVDPDQTAPGKEQSDADLHFSF